MKSKTDRRRLVVGACAWAVALTLLWHAPEVVAQSGVDAAPPASSAAAAVESASAALPDYTGALVRMLVTLLVMIGVLLAVARYLPRWISGRGAGSGRAEGIDVVSTRRLEPGRSLHVVRAGGRTLLVGSGPQGLNLVADLTPRPEQGEVVGVPAFPARTVAPSAEPGARFGAALASQPAKEPLDEPTDHLAPARG